MRCTRPALWVSLLTVLATVATLVAPIPTAGAQSDPCHEPHATPPAAAEPDLEYDYWVVGPDARAIDLFVPDQPPSPEGRPIIVFVHGGSWRHGTETLRPGEGVLGYVDAGYVVASIDIRLPCERNPLTGSAYPWQTSLYDIWTAVAWFREVLDPARPDLQLNTDHIVLWGIGSGGHLATVAAAAVDVTTLAARSHVQGVVSLFGVYDLAADELDQTGAGEPLWPELVGAAGDLLACGGPLSTCSPSRRWSASPHPYLDPQDPPMLVLHGGNDAVVPFGNAEEFFATLTIIRSGVWTGGEVLENGTDVFVRARSVQHPDPATSQCVGNPGGVEDEAGHGCIAGPPAHRAAGAIDGFLAGLG